MRFRLILWIFLIGHIVVCDAQQQTDFKLAKQYLENQEFEKAEWLYQNLYISNPREVFSPYLNCLLSLRKYQDALDLAKKYLVKYPDQFETHIYIASVYQKQKDSTKAKREFQIAIDICSRSFDRTLFLYEFLIKNRQSELIINLIETAREKQKLPNILSNEYIEALLETGQNKKAAKQLVEFIKTKKEDYLSSMNQIQMFISKKELANELERQIYTQISKEPNEIKWSEIAIWLSIQLKNFEDAVQQSKAIDKRQHENGNRVIMISDLAFGENDYHASINGYQYVIEKGKSYPFYVEACQKKLLSVVTSYQKNGQIDSIKISNASKLFVNFFNEFGYKAQSAQTQILYARYLVEFTSNIDSAIVLLQHLTSQYGIPNHIMSRAKLDLGDYLLAKGDLWEAALLYGQVDREEKDSPLGEEARYKSAKLFYFNGDFELAQDILTILKSSTTELISNDALYTAQFIQDNMASDSLQKVLKNIADAELFVFQNKLDQALLILDTTIKQNSKSNAIDDILFLKYQIYYKKRAYQDAENSLDTLVHQYPEEIITDKAYFYLAELQENILNKKSEAKENYLKILLKFKDSVYATESSKRYRALRGDLLQEDF